MRNLFVPLLLLSLAACGSAPKRYSPPVVDQSGAPPVTDALPQGEPLGQTAPAPRPAAGGSAVVALLDQAQARMRAGDPDAAAAVLERALRIEPRNARLWSQLAWVRLRQGLPAQAEQTALKSNALARADYRLQAANWRIIAKARWAQNDADRAVAAERRARDFEERGLREPARVQ